MQRRLQPLEAHVWRSFRRVAAVVQVPCGWAPLLWHEASRTPPYATPPSDAPHSATAPSWSLLSSMSRSTSPLHFPRCTPSHYFPRTTSPAVPLLSTSPQHVLPPALLPPILPTAGDLGGRERRDVRLVGVGPPVIELRRRPGHLRHAIPSLSRGCPHGPRGGASGPLWRRPARPQTCLDGARASDQGQRHTPRRCGAALRNPRSTLHVPSHGPSHEPSTDTYRYTSHGPRVRHIRGDGRRIATTLAWRLTLETLSSPQLVPAHP